MEIVAEEVKEPEVEEMAPPKKDEPKLLKVGVAGKDGVAAATVPMWAQKGVAAAHGWAEGKVVTQEEYDQALSGFLAGPLFKEK